MLRFSTFLNNRCIKLISLHIWNGHRPLQINTVFMYTINQLNYLILISIAYGEIINEVVNQTICTSENLGNNICI